MADEVVAESVGLSEGIVVASHQFVSVSEQVHLTENISSGSFDVETVDGVTIRVTTPFELHFDNALDLSNYQFSPNPEGDTPGNPLVLKEVSPRYTIYQTGSSGAVIPEQISPGVYDLKDGKSDIFQFSGYISALLNLGDFIFLRDGVNAGLYQILEVLNDGPAFARVRLDKPLSLMYADHGVSTTDQVELVDVTNRVGLLATGSSDLVFQVNHPLVTPSNPLKAVYALEQKSREGSPILEALNAETVLSAEVSGSVVAATTFDLSLIQFLDYRTFSLPNPGQPVLRGTVAADPTSSVESHLVVFQTASYLDWTHLSGIQGFDFKTSKILNNADFQFQARNLYLKYPRTAYTSEVLAFTSQGIKAPRLLTTQVDSEGTLHLTFDSDMQQDGGNLTNSSDYTITGPTTVRVKEVQSSGLRKVSLFTEGLREGDYTLTISTSTPKDVAGNILDPTYNSAIFTASTPIRNRSLFTDKGPIAKPELLLQSGATATVSSLQELALPGATLTSSDIGKKIRVTGSATNDDDYRILSVLSATSVRVEARLNYPDANSGTISWSLIDPRNGMIADDPADVTVRVNGSEVTPDAVIGLRGQVVLPSMPEEDDVVEIDYCHICNPRVEIRRLNSKEFRLNSWNRDGRANSDSRHNYRFNNVLIRPSHYEPNDIQATLEAPLLRSLKYRGYERAYTATLNDPNRLLLNTPSHRIAYPPAQRQLAEASVFYEGTVLPENDSLPWVRHGSGLASVAAGTLTVIDNSTGPSPNGSGLFWTRSLDLTYDHVFSAAWRGSVTSVTTYEGVWSGIAAGYSDSLLAYVLGYLEVAGVKKIGFMKRGALDNLESPDAWIGGLDALDNPTGEAVDFDWGALHSYRLFRDPSGTVRLYVDGDVVETLRIVPSEAPFLEEVNGPFEELQGVFFGSLSRPAESTSNWDFVRYLSQPTNVFQTAPSSFVSYEATVLPEVDPSPWTPVGFHGTSSIQSADYLVLESTSATDAPQGLIGGDFRGYFKMEPLLSAASQFSVDFSPRLLTHTHGIDPYGLMVGVDDGNRLMQVAFLSDTPAPKLSYGGRTLPEDFTPTTWASLGSQTRVMQGRYLRILDTDSSDGLVYYAEDTQPVVSEDRVLASGIDYILEARFKMNSYTPDPSGGCGAFIQAYDSLRSLGALLVEDSGTRYVSLHSEGVELGPAYRFAFEWYDDEFHTIRLRKDTGGSLVSLFVDGTLLGSADYSLFSIPPADPIGQVSFGSATVVSSQSESDVEWAYCNAWRVPLSERRYLGLWKGTTLGDLTDYHVPLKTSGKGAAAQGNTLADPLADFIVANVVAGDLLVVDHGTNKGVYEVASVGGAGSLTILGTWVVGPTTVDYRILRETDWTAVNKYRLFRDSNGEVGLFLNTDTEPLLRVGYNSIDLPVSGVGIIRTVSNGIPSIVFGSFSQEHLEQSMWDYVRYGITRSPTELRIVPINHVLNQWNVMESPERLFTTIPHVLTDFKSSSTGATPSTDPDFLALDSVAAYTTLNQGTPLVPLTQSFEVRGPYVSQTYISVLSDPEDVLSSDDSFTLNDGSVRYTMAVPDDVLYASLQVIESEEGEPDILQPFGEECGPQLGAIQYLKEVCLTYTGDTLPESDTSAFTPWQQAADNPGAVTASSAGSILTYGTSGSTRTAYLNNTPLPDAPSLQTEVRFRLKLSQDATLGTGDSQVRFGLSAPGMTIGLGFVTTVLGDRFVQVFDLNNGIVLGYATFDYLDGNYHDYRIVRTPGPDLVQIFIDA